MSRTVAAFLLLASVGSAFSAGSGAAAELDQNGTVQSWKGDGSHIAGAAALPSSKLR